MNSAPSTPSMEPKQDHLLQKQDHMAPVTVHHNMEREPAPSYFGSEQSSGGSAKPGACLIDNFSIFNYLTIWRSWHYHFAISRILVIWRIT